MKRIVNLKDIINESDKFYAHTADGKKAETLVQHTELCTKYMEKLITDKGVMSVLQRFRALVFPDLKEAAWDLFCIMFENLPVFHDLGKINPRFQRERMNNNAITAEPIEGVNGANHALLSSAIYLDYFFHRIKKQEDVNKDDKKILRNVCMINAYVISRHHGNLVELESYLANFAAHFAVYDIFRFFLNEEQKVYRGPFYYTHKRLENIERIMNRWNNMRDSLDREKSCMLAAYTRLACSLLVAADYYATTEYMDSIKTMQFGSDKAGLQWKDIFEHTALTKSIRSYEMSFYGKQTDFSAETDINILRDELYLDAEKQMCLHMDQNLFFMEAPTGSGKSNVAVNLSLNLIGKGMKKLYYVYPLNTLIEQNMNTLKDTFGQSQEVFEQITVVNSVVPIKADKKSIENECSEAYYARALLDRQFLNYPFILTTHVSLFQTLFGDGRQDVFGFYQCIDSVLVLDEVQNYKNKIWTEMITFLSAYAKLLNMKIIIMSATLPRLDYLLQEKGNICDLISCHDKYYHHPLFRNRVEVSYELLEKTDFEMGDLFTHVMQQFRNQQKVLVEFIYKRTANAFYEMCACADTQDLEIYLITGDTNPYERAEIIDKIKHGKGRALLIGTQVIEAGIDIDMDIGYKNISILDSEEQFLGRINRSAKKCGKAYFFKLDEAKKIYGSDFRISAELTLLNPQMQNVLREKDFAEYYGKVMKLLQDQWNDKANEDGLMAFFGTVVRRLDFVKIAKRMQLIDDDNRDREVYLARKIIINGEEIDGWKVWECYKSTLKNSTYSYSEKQVRLSEIRSKMMNFIYRVSRKSDISFQDQIGELICIQNGEKYFTDGRFNRELLEREDGIFY